jgi:hypothetical protein
VRQIVRDARGGLLTPPMLQNYDAFARRYAVNPFADGGAS